MLSKNYRLLAVLLAAVLAIAAFGSDFYSAKVWAADEEGVETYGEGIVLEAIPEEGDTDSEVEEASVEEASDGEFAETDEVVENAEADEAGALETEISAESDEALAEEAEAVEGAEAAEVTDAEAVEALAEEAEAVEGAEAAEVTDAEAVEAYPAQSFFDSVAGMNVSVEANEGAFPEGTTMRLSAISDSQAVSAAEDALDGTVKEAKGVDISFANKEGEEIEPKAAVSVSITLADALEGDSFSVVHLDNNGNSEMVAGASSNGASFAADSFSVYILAGLGDEENDDLRAVATYNFYHNGEVFNSQRVKAGDELKDPGSPISNDGNQVFIGWTSSEESNIYGVDPFEFGTVDAVEAGAVYKVYSSVAGYDLTVGNNGAFSFVIRITTGNSIKVVSLSSGEGDDSVEFLVDGQQEQLDPDISEHLKSRAVTATDGMEITCEVIEYLRGNSEEKVIEPEYTSITYHINYGDEDITHTVSALSVNEAVAAISNTDINWEREGYRFIGWSKKAGEGNTPVFATIGALMAADNDGIPNDLYAIWEKVEEEKTEDPTDPVDPEDPADPVDPKDPTDPVDPTDPTEEPSNPADPEEKQDDPTDPEDPAEDPVTPSDSEDPKEDPATSSDNENPVPSTPSTSETPAPTVVSSSTETEPEPEEVVIYFVSEPETEPVTEAAPAADLPEVLGATRSDELPEVLGARRGATSDASKLAGRLVAIIVAALATAGLLILGKRKEEE